MKRTMKHFWRTLAALVFAAALLSGSLPALADDGEQSLPDWTGEVAVAGKNLAADLLATVCGRAAMWASQGLPAWSFTRAACWMW